MRGIGIIMILLAIGSMIIPLFGVQFILLSWVDNWGLAAGIGIRIGIALLGGVLIFLGGGGEDE